MKFWFTILYLSFFWQLNAQLPQILRVDRFNGNGGESSRSVISDHHGGYFVSLSFTDSMDIDPSPTQDFWYTYPLGARCIAHYSQTGQLLWHHIMPDSCSTVHEMICDTAGNLYVTANYQGDFVVDSLNNFDFTNCIGFGVPDFYIAKFNPSGSVAWVHFFEELNSTQHSNSLYTMTLSNDTLLLIGRLQGTVDFDPDTSQFNLQGSTSNNTASIFIVQWDTSSRFLNARLVMSTTGVAFGVRKTTIDALGNIYIGGNVESALQFTPTISGGSTSNCFVVKLNSSLQTIWAYSIGATGNDQTVADMLIQDSVLILIGMNPTNSDFDPGPAVHNVVGSDVFIARYDTSMNFRWAKTIGNTNNNTDFSVIDADLINSTIVICGGFSGTGDLDPTSGYYPITSTTATAYYSTYSLDSGFLCAGSQFTISSGSNMSVTEIDHDSNGQMFLNFSWSGSFDADLSSGTSTLVENLFTDTNYLGVHRDAAVVIYETAYVGYNETASHYVPVSVYPNPTTGIIHISINTPLAEVIITDVSGRTIKEVSNINSENVQIDCTGYSPGIYFITATDCFGNIGSEKLILSN